MERPEAHRHLGPHRCVEVPDSPASALPRPNLAEEPDHEYHGRSNNGKVRRTVSVEPQENARGERDAGPDVRQVPSPRPVPKESNDREDGDGKACEKKHHEDRGLGSEHETDAPDRAPAGEDPDHHGPDHDPSENGDDPYRAASPSRVSQLGPSLDRYAASPTDPSIGGAPASIQGEPDADDQHQSARYRGDQNCRQGDLHARIVRPGSDARP